MPKCYSEQEREYIQKRLKEEADERTAAYLFVTPLGKNGYLAAGGTLQGLIISLLIVTLSSNKLEGMAITKLSSLMIFGAVIPFFIKHNVQYVISPLPSFWIGKAVCENQLLYLFPAYILSVLWIWILLKRFLHKI